MGALMPRYRKTTKHTAPLPRRFIITTSEKATVRPKSVAVMGLIASEKKKKGKLTLKRNYNVWLIFIKFQLALLNFR